MFYDPLAEIFNEEAKNGNPEKVIKKLKLTNNTTIMDVGSGGGYFTFQFSQIVSNSIVYAVDINSSLLKYIKEYANLHNFNNIKTVHLSEIENIIPISSVDLIFMRDVTHHVNDRIILFTLLKKFLKQDGRFAIIEYIEDEKRKNIELRGHFVPKPIIEDEMSKVGYLKVEDYSFLEEQHFTVYINE